MEKINNNGQATQGVDLPPESITIATIEQWLKKDLQMSINLLTAIQTDPAILHQVATFMQGRLNNHLEAKKNQTKLDL